MKYSLVNGIKQEPTPKNKGFCIFCGGATTAKCGKQKVWHWAHDSKQMCDSWWENETPWHRQWKNYFPKHNQEVIHYDVLTGEKHIADVKTDNNLVIEFQNSPMNQVELESRENFYGAMVWIINGEKFRDNFTIGLKIPDPFSKIAEDILILPNGLLAKKKEITIPLENNCFEFYEYGDFEKEIQESYNGHHFFDWKSKRDIWYLSKKPVFIDFGDKFLWELQVYDEENYKQYLMMPTRCVKKILKEDFIKNNGGEYKSIYEHEN